MIGIYSKIRAINRVHNVKRTLALETFACGCHQSSSRVDIAMFPINDKLHTQNTSVRSISYQWSTFIALNNFGKIYYKISIQIKILWYNCRAQAALLCWSLSFPGSWSWRGPRSTSTTSWWTLSWLRGWVKGFPTFTSRIKH